MTGFRLYLVFVVSWFLHLGSRLPFLGVIRFDLLLVLALTALAFTRAAAPAAEKNRTATIIFTLLGYSIVTLPFVEWPGSVLRFGLDGWVKGAVFFFFTIAFIDTTARLKIFLWVFLSCQLWRILEPLYLHVTQGYWGSMASMANWEFMYRLSGAPSDVVNPNGLAFIVCTVLPFLYFFQSLAWWTRLAFLFVTPALLYTLVLTGSRSGFLALMVIFVGIVWKSKRRLFVAASGVLIAVVVFPLLSPDTQDRYLSVFGAGEKNAATAEGRLEGIEGDLTVALRRPLFGHGLGTSMEANANFRGGAQRAHNLYTETAQELGFIGLMLLLALIKSIIVNFQKACVRLRGIPDADPFLVAVVEAMQVWLLMNLMFSFASYGLSSYEWYLFAGLSVVVLRCLPRGPGNERAETQAGTMARASMPYPGRRTRVAS